LCKFTPTSDTFICRAPDGRSSVTQRLGLSTSTSPSKSTPDGIAREPFPDLVLRPVEHLLAVIDQQNGSAHLFDLLHLMGAHYDRRTPVSDAIEKMLDQACVDRVQP
jgi:hypothetical protein